jgi:biopolymer transport protein ExbD
MPASPRQHDEHSGPQLRLTSMLDVCFLLLIFFVLTASFAVGEGVLPFQGLGKAPAEPPPAMPIRIDVRSLGGSDASITIAGTPFAVTGTAELAERLRAMSTGPAAPYTTEDHVVIAPDATVPWRHVVAVYNAALTAEFQFINFATARP